MHVAQTPHVAAMRTWSVLTYLALCETPPGRQCPWRPSQFLVQVLVGLHRTPNR